MVKKNKTSKWSPLGAKNKKFPRRRSKKTEEIYAERRKFVVRILGERPLCQACGIFAKHDGKAIYNQHLSSDVHEIVRRSQGGSILDEKNVLAVCRPCHYRITINPQLAFDLQLAKRSWEK
jgi:5-methylcytosine-specific restriction endonuclease McrA